jgi:hypothetical protein
MRMTRVLILSVAAVAVLVGSAAAQTSQPVGGAPALANLPPAIARSIRAIREANTMAAAAEAYAEGADVDRESVELNTAYMRRLLQLGLPDIANGPAATLVRIPVADGTGYGVLGYNCGRQNDLTNALSYTMKAAGLIKDDPSIQNNLGQLTAWYECAKPYKLPAADQKALDDLKADLASAAPYKAGYKLIKDAYDKHIHAQADAKQKLATAEADVKAAEKRVADAQARVNQGGGANPPGRGGRGGPGGAQRQLDDARNNLAQKVQALNTIRGQQPEGPLSYAKLFHWLPPAVDGVVTPQADPKSKPQPASAPAGN